MAEDELSQRLSVVLAEIGDLMQQRKEQVEQLRDQITLIENQNEDLEKQIQEIMNGFG
jgi:DNA-binding transcriptional MerR regulator